MDNEEKWLQTLAGVSTGIIKSLKGEEKQVV